MPVIILLLALLLTVTGGLVNNSIRVDQIHKLEQTLSARKTQSVEAVAKATGAVRSTESVLQATSADTRKETNEKITSLTAERDNLLRRLRDSEARAKSAAAVPSSSHLASSGQALEDGDGTQLLATIGEEDVEEATRGDTIRLHLEACYSQYDRAKAALERLGQSGVKD